MTEFRRQGDRLDVHFDGDDDLQIARTFIAICAYPEFRNLGYDGQAHKFFDAMRAYVLRNAYRRGAIDSLPSNLPATREMYARLDKGADRIDRFRDVHCSLTASAFSSGLIQIEPSANMRRFNVRIAIRGGPLEEPKQPSISQLLAYHHQYFCSGDGSAEGSRDLAKRIVRPLARIGHLVTLLHGHILGMNLERGRDWFPELLFAEPNWARPMVQQSTLWGKFEVDVWRFLGVRSASPDNMVHLHLG